MDVRLANPRGFCAGVDRAIDIVNRALDLFGAPIYVRHEVVHNKFVVDQLRERGAIFVDELKDIPRGSIVIFSAHGVSKEVCAEAEQRGLKVFDATCPLVTKVHLEVEKFSREGRECVLIGHYGHPEVEGTMGQYDAANGGDIYLVENVDDVAILPINRPDNLAFVTQTTLSVDDTARVIDALRSRFPDIEGPRKDDICYATQNRQDAIKQLALECDVLLVVGSANSSNSNRLRELAERCGTKAYLVDSSADIKGEWFKSGSVVGVSAGASAPETLVQELVDALADGDRAGVKELPGKVEDIRFSVPKELRKSSPSGS